jgi:membrane carboxypeptidase/penicillin-binding protein
MRRALASRPDRGFEAPAGIEFAEIDKANGKLATPLCPVIFNEAFLAGTAPKELCDIHGSALSAGGFFHRLGELFGR